jgi:WD40 repeat protein
LATCGADKIVNYWDPRNPQKPVFSIGDCHNVLLSCDFMPNCQQILVTSMEGEIMMVSVKRQMSIFMHDTLPALRDERKKLLEANNLDGIKEKELKEIDQISNQLWACTSVKGVEQLDGHFLVGDELGQIIKYKMDLAEYSKLDTFFGHSLAIRSLEVNKSGTKLASGCADHSIRIWNYESCQAEKLLAGHTDLVVS